MAMKTGICMNLDCDNYKKEVEVEPGGEFECPLCHQSLREGKGRNGGNTPGSNKKKTIMIVGGLVVAIGVAIGITISIGNKSTTSATPPRETGVDTNSVKVNTPTVAVIPQGVDTFKEKSKDPKPEPPQPLNGKGTVNLKYGIYTGDLKNGKPHGNGIITYKTSSKIVPSKEFVANPGDTFEGEFRDGKISGLGYWKHDGDETVVKP